MSGKVEDSRSKVIKMVGKWEKLAESLLSVEVLCLGSLFCLWNFLYLEILLSLVLYDPNADIRTRYRSKVYSEQCVQSKHREITNYYIGTTVAFIACYISDLIFLEGQICILTVTPFCVLSSFLLWSLGGIKKNLGILLTSSKKKSLSLRNSLGIVDPMVGVSKLNNLNLAFTTPTGSLVTP